MVLNNLGNGNIDCGPCLITYQPQQPCDFKVTSGDGQKLEGHVPASGFVDVTPPGKSPWTVEMGSGGFSRSATVTGITSPDAVLSLILVFPMGPNEGHIFVNKAAAS
jgi:hypothetical protein